MRIAGCIAVAILGLSIGCKPSDTTIDKKSDASKLLTQSEKIIEIQGAGASFPYPLYSKWMAEYQKVDPRIRVNYQSIGSGGGIRQVMEKIVDFGGSDAPMVDEELAKAPGKIFHIPTTLGAVVVAYNLAGVVGLKLSSEVVARIFLGEIKNWDDSAIAALNVGVVLPSQPISIVYRTDGSGTTAVFTEYLSKTNAAWKEKVGAGKSVKFPIGLGAKGNEGISGQMKMAPGSIGYVELAYAKQAKLAYAFIQNSQGRFVEPSLESVAAAADSVAGRIPEDLRVSIVDASGELSYPISAFTYVLVYEEQADLSKGVELAKFLWWAIHDGQKLGAPLHYAPLPSQVVTKIEAKLREMRVGKQMLLTAKN
ncbi:MAG: phosphate ABC transporter substrate-binding protein PstS [Proteobacteria bacterium]|nr:phosphate ABC transporter substrate-binding protein PstS [Cystobacterineae bacterium]MCL2258461.1 phosphate ABC transporter substrate-binding protein PstS [Cystobacterineae bacterium]MCL2315200.1 phosphate ABC transporter substrate-binding protein PstS [Pseudomonadota bacterium]